MRLSEGGSLNHEPQDVRLSEAGRLDDMLARTMAEAMARHSSAEALPEADPKVAQSLPSEAEQAPAESTSSFHEASRLLLRKIVQSESPDDLPKIAGADKISPEERDGWFAKLKTGAAAEMAKRDAGKESGAFKPIHELNAAKAQAAASNAADRKTHEQAPTEASPVTDKIPTQIEAPTASKTEAEKYDAKYAVMGEDKIMDLGYRISELGDDTATEGMSVEEQKALARAYNSIVSKAEAEYYATDPSWILQWKENENVKPLPRGYQSLLDKHAKRAESELLDYYRRMDSEQLIRLHDNGMPDIKSQAERGIYYSQLNRAENELRAEINEMTPQEIIADYESKLANPSPQRSKRYMEVLEAHYKHAHNVIHDANEKYGKMTPVELMNAADQVFAGKMPDDEFAVFAEKYQAALGNIESRLKQMPKHEIVSLYEGFQNNPTMPKPEGLLAAMQKSYEAALEPKREAYALRNKALTYGNGKLIDGLAYLTTEELNQIHDYASGPMWAAKQLKARDAASKKHDKFAAKTARDSMKGKAPNAKHQLKIEQATAKANEHHEELSSVYNTTDTKLLTKRDLRELEYELLDRERGDKYMQSVFERALKADETDPGKGVLQFMGLESVADKIPLAFDPEERIPPLDPNLKHAIDKGNGKWLDITPDISRAAYDRQVIQILHNSSSLADSILLHRDSLGQLYSQLRTGPGRVQLRELYEQRMKVLDERLRKNTNKQEAA